MAERRRVGLRLQRLERRRRPDSLVLLVFREGDCRRASKKEKEHGVSERDVVGARCGCGGGRKKERTLDSLDIPAVALTHS